MDNLENTHDSQTNNPTVLQSAIKWGVILGAISVIISLLIYIIDLTLFASFSLLFVMLGLLLAITIFGGIKFRNQGDGYLSFGKAFQFSFFTMAIGGIIGVIFQFLLFNVIDPDAAEVVMDASIENTTKMLEGFGMDPDQLDEQMEKAREQAEAQFSIGTLIKNYLFGLIMYAILSLIAGAIIKKKNPEDEI